MIRLSPYLLIATASALLRLGAHPEDHAPGGPIDQLRTALPLDDEPEGVEPVGAPWDVPLVLHCGYWSHFDHRSERSAWPVAAVRTSPELAAFGAQHGVIHDSPEDGDIFLQYGPRQRRFVHAGIVVSVVAHGRSSRSTPYFDVVTIEGDTDQSGRLGGGVTLRVKRRLSPAAGDRFLRWTELERYDHYLARARLPGIANARRSA
jgi:hypothetical protein